MNKLYRLAPSPSLGPPGRHWDPSTSPSLTGNQAALLIFGVVFVLVCAWAWRRAKKNPNNSGW